MSRGPSQEIHCSPCDFGELPEPELSTRMDMLRWRQECNYETTAVQIIVIEEHVRRAAPDTVDQDDLKPYESKHTEASRACAQKIMDGSCELYMVRKPGQYPGQIATKLTLEQGEANNG